MYIRIHRESHPPQFEPGGLRDYIKRAGTAEEGSGDRTDNVFFLEETNMTEASEALLSITPPTEYGEWVKISMAYKAAGGDFQTWLDWCKTGSNPISEAEAPNKWASFKEGGGINPGTLYMAAMREGWQNHRQGTAKAPPTRETPTPKKEQGAGLDNAERAAAEAIRQSRGETTGALTYLAARGISKETAEFFQVGELTGRNEAIFPYLGENKPYYVARNMGIMPNAPKEQGQRWRFPAGLPKRPYNMAAALNGEGGDIFLVEGQIDVLSMAEAGHRAITAKDCEKILAKTAKENGKPWRFIIMPDNDEEGRGYAEKMHNALTAEGLTAYIANIPKEYHDANDYLRRDRRGLETWAATAGDQAEDEAHITYNAQSAAEKIDQWETDWQSGRDTPLSTGFPSLDKILDGGLYPGLYVIGALSSLGKTTFALQIADYIARGHDVLYVALEQSAAELTAKTLSRLTADISNMDGDEWKNALTARSITSKEKRQRNGKDQMQTLARAIAKYREGIGKRIFFLEGMGDIGTEAIRARLAEHKKHRQQFPLVIVDYVQILAPYSDRMTDKQNMDKNIVELKRMARDYNIPILGVSSFNRENYNAKLSMAAFKESGAIEYTADVVIGLQPQGMKDAANDREAADNRQTIEASRNANPATLELRVLKNRQGAIGTALFEHNKLFNLFSDKGARAEPDISAFMQNLG